MDRIVVNRYTEKKYRDLVAEATRKIDEKFPAYNPRHQHIHFNRSADRFNGGDSRMDYFYEAIAKAVFYMRASMVAPNVKLKDEAIAESMMWLGYGLHALQDIVAHGNIGINDRLASHVGYSRWGNRDNERRTWHHADNPEYRWQGENMTRLVLDRGYDGDNPMTSERVGLSAILTILGVSYFLRNLSQNERRVICL